jgi:hypothetical protein
MQKEVHMIGGLCRQKVRDAKGFEAFLNLHKKNQGIR